MKIFLNLAENTGATSEVLFFPMHLTITFEAIREKACR